MNDVAAAGGLPGATWPFYLALLVALAAAACLPGTSLWLPELLTR